MIWRRIWTATRWRFVFAMAVMLAAGFSMVMTYPRIAAASAAAAKRGLAPHPELSFPTYAWDWWFSMAYAALWVLAASLLAPGGLAREARRGEALFTLSLPVTRARLLGEHAAVVLAELIAIAIAGAAIVPLAAPLVGQSYSWSEALLFAASAVLGGLGVFALAILVSTSAAAGWLQPLITAGLVFLVSEAAGAFLQNVAAPTPMRVMSAWSYVEIGRPPYIGWTVSAIVALVGLAAARGALERRDF